MKNQRKINLIVVHCSATRVNQDFPVEALEACHKARGFKSIGYHYYITKDGVVYPCRPETEVGAHARHYNAHSIGICYEISLLCSVLPRLGDGDRCPRNRTSAISGAVGIASAPDRHTGRGDCIGCAETGCPAP